MDKSYTTRPVVFMAGFWHLRWKTETVHVFALGLPDTTSSREAAVLFT